MVNRNIHDKPVIGITMGDGAGIGPEIIVKALTDKNIYNLCQPLVIGDRDNMERAALLAKAPVTVRGIKKIEEAHYVYGTLDVLDLENLPSDLPYGQVDGRAGKAAHDYIEAAVALALKGQLEAVVTAPLNKEALKLGGCSHPGHTEILADLSKTIDYSMMLTSKSLRVIHVTTHVSIRKACDLIKKERVLKIIKLADKAVRALGIASPRIAVAGFNPHSGEGGLFGTEEIEEIIPAIEEARSLGLNATGPIPPDTVFYRTAVKKEFDIVVVMYHDQGHIPLKLHGFETGVNVTVGLPFIRTSVDHGTAFDIAGKGMADSSSMTEAIRFAATMALAKRINK
jgi:4-phospho-D-threonate 3-dehydrogenase / 4-phospho-D-erythronate 3-dehydrogenase